MKEPQKMYIDGSWCHAADGNAFEDRNPATGEVWARVADASRQDAARAISAAQAALPAWRGLAPSARGNYLLKVADILERKQKELAAIRVEEGGAWIGFGMFETGYTPGIFRAAAAVCYQAVGEVMPSNYGKLSLVVREPLGVVAAISPWNAPLLLSSRAIAVALAVGNTVVLKPSEETPVAGGTVLARAFEEAGLPQGVLNLVTCSRENIGEVGDELVSNPAVRGISFTGSTAIGRKIGAQAGALLKRACLELGGKDALIVLDDADMDRALSAASFGSFMHQGQICMALEKIVLHKNIAAEFTERFVALAQGLKSGDPHEMGNVIGPIINQRQLDKIVAQVQDAKDKGARVLLGGSHRGLFHDATILTNVEPEMSVYRDETFGPVAPLVTVASDEEAARVANDTEYGLSAGIITRDEQRGMELAKKLDTGMAHINCSSVNDEPWIPFGGVKSSGVGRHGGAGSVDSFTQTRWITAERGGRAFPPPFVPKKK